MTNLKAMLRDATAGTKLIVVGPHTEWMERPEEEQVYSDEALAFVMASLRRTFKHERAGRFSPSALGKCPRRVVFGFAGAPQLPTDIDNQEQADHGSWAHLKWQAEGLTMGYMTDAEVWVHDPEMLFGGSMDATLHEGSFFELKTVIWNKFNRIVMVANWPDYEHLLQTAGYMLLTDKDMASLVYEDRGSGQFHEFRIPRTNRLEREVLRLLRSYLSYAENDELPPMLPDCEIRIGNVYKRCPYRDLCPMAKSISEFGKVTA